MKDEEVTDFNVLERGQCDAQGSHSHLTAYSQELGFTARLLLAVRTGCLMLVRIS